MIRLLHVDDDRTILEITALFLGKSGDFCIDSATSGESAIEMLTSKAYDAIVSDIHMPGCSGLDLLRYVRERDGDTPFLIFSDQSDEEIVIDALTSGADFFLQKGLHVRSQCIQLEHAIRESVMRRRAEKKHDSVSSRLRILEAAIHGSPFPIAFCDTNGRLRYANRAGIMLWGYSDETEVTGKFATEFVVSPEIDDRVIPDLLSMGGWSGQAVVRRKDGSLFDVQVHVNVVPDDSGVPLGFIASFTDITKERKTRARLESYIRDMRIFSEKASEMADFPAEGDIYSFIADSLALLVPAGSIVIVSSIRHGPIVRVEAIRGRGEDLAAVARILGQSPAELEFPLPSEESPLSIPPSVFVPVEGGIRTITFGLLPEDLCNQIEELHLFERIIGCSMVWGGSIHASCVVLLPPGCAVENTDVLDLFILHCSAVLQRRQAERLLHDLRKR